MLTPLTDSPGSCSFIAWAASAMSSAVARVVANGVPNGNCSST